MGFNARAALFALSVACAVAIAQPDAASQQRLARHADLFAVGRAGWPRLEDMTPDSDGVIRFHHAIIRDYMLRSKPLTPAQELAQLASRVDAVVSGTTVNRYSAENSLHTALYSDWIVHVIKVYKGLPSIPAQAGTGITVTRIGGDMSLQGHRVIYTDPGFPEFTMNHEYVFYLQYQPDTSSFIAISGGTFDVSGKAPVLLADPKNPTAVRAFSSFPVEDFLTSVERSVAQ